jgi:beta-mannosidase
LEQYSAKLSDLWCRITIYTDNKTASIKVAAETEGCNADDTIRLTISNPTGKATGKASILPVSENSANTTVEIQDAQFWWPIGYGQQPLYTVSAELLRDVGPPNTTRI